MKIFIYLCCIAHLLTEISARIRLTTALPLSLRSKLNDDAAEQDSNVVDMIKYINSVFGNDGGSKARSGRYDPLLRRFELLAVQGKNLPSNVVVPNDEDVENQLEKLETAVRYHVIDNPEVLEEYKNKQKRKNDAPLFKAAPVTSDTSVEAKSFSTVENKLRYYHSKSKSTASHKSTSRKKFDRLNHPKPLNGVQELTTVESTYRPSFPDDEDDDDKLVTEDIEVTVTEKAIKTPRADAKNHGRNTEKHHEVNNTVEIEKRTLDNEPSGKEEEKAHTDNTTEGQIKNKTPLKTDKSNDGVTLNEEKKGSNKENKSAQIDNNSNKNLTKDNVRPGDKGTKNDRNKQINGTMDTKIEKVKNSKDGSSDTNELINLPVEILIERLKKSALRTKKKNNNRDHLEQASKYSHKERNENSNEQFKNRHEKRDEYDRKKKYKNDDGWTRKEKNWNKIHKQQYKKNDGNDRMEYEWNKRHQQYDDSDNLNGNDNDWDKNDDFNSRDRDWNNKKNYWDKRENDWKKTDRDWDERYNDWNKRDNDRNERDNDKNERDNNRNERDIDSKKQYRDWKKRDKEWNKRDNEWIRKETYSPIDDRKQNVWEKKYLKMSVENDRDVHERYRIVGRKRKDGDYNRHSEV